MAKFPSTLPRSVITDYLLEELRTSGFPVGDMTTPKVPHGWQSDQADAPESMFIPYTVLNVGPSNAPTGSVGDSATEHELNYSVTYTGVSRANTEDFADHMRQQMVRVARNGLEHQDESVEPNVITRWRITQVRNNRIGAIQRISAVVPDYYIQTDDFIVRVSKERT